MRMPKGKRRRMSRRLRRGVKPRRNKTRESDYSRVGSRRRGMISFSYAAEKNVNKPSASKSMELSPLN